MTFLCSRHVLVFCRPSVLAAAALAVDRRLNGITPIWPSSLQPWTGIPSEFNRNEFAAAITKITQIAEAIAFGHKQPVHTNIPETSPVFAANDLYHPAADAPKGYTFPELD